MFSVQDLFSINPCQHPIVVLKDISFLDLKCVVDFIYYGEVNVAQERLQSILRVMIFYFLDLRFLFVASTRASTLILRFTLILSQLYVIGWICSFPSHFLLFHV